MPKVNGNRSCPTAVAILCLLSAVSGQFPVKFDCPQLPPLSRPAETVYELKPQDIKVVMALGDSITAGFGMMGRHGDLFEDLQEYRGQSWCIGGDANASTIGSFLRFYSPEVQGLSLGHHIGELCYGPLCPPFQYESSKDVLDAAQSGAMIPNLVSHEFKYLHDMLLEMELERKIDIFKDWKLLTILIGANDLCLACSGNVPFLTADDFEKNLIDVLEEVRTKIPRVFVNLVPMFNLSQVYEISLKSKHCIDVHRLLPIECICAFAPGEEGDKLRRDLDERVVQYNQRILKVADEYSGKYKEFAAVAQPCFMNARHESLPITIISTLDCFHPSLFMHELMAKVMWNCMLAPASKKITTFDAQANFTCPTSSSIFHTD